MPNHLLAYHGGKKPETPEEGKAAIAKWMAWFGGIEGKIVDDGNPVGMSKTVSTSGTTDSGGVNPVSGYSIIKASDINEACNIANGCPIVTGGGTVEVAEIIPV
jgi:hypothetical protein